MAHRAHKPHNFRALSKPKKVQKQEHKHYWPYIPVLLLVIATFLMSIVQPMQRHGVLAYATNVSNSGLLNSTNTQRSNNGVGGLLINGNLNAAAQSKANDMVARNYWSHNTPDGKEPWVFIDNAGYKYTKAGENLAYGFTSSDNTITGWMNSQSHKDNMLDSNFTEVGFGYANSENFNNSGPETIVVAMYGKPQVLAAESPAPVAATPVTPPPAPVTTTKTQQENIKPNPKPVVEKAKTVASTPITSNLAELTEPPTQQIARIQTITNGRTSWAPFGLGIIIGLTMAFIFIKHLNSLRHLLIGSEKFILHHPSLDAVLVSILLIGTFLSQTSGFIK